MTYLLWENNEWTGPFWEEEITAMIHDGKITVDDFVYPNGARSGVQIRSVPAFRTTPQEELPSAAAHLSAAVVDGDFERTLRSFRVRRRDGAKR